MQVSPRRTLDAQARRGAQDARRQTAGRPLARERSRAGGKSGLHGTTVPVNGRRGRPQGKCHREQTARTPCGLLAARVKRWGKSPPRFRQRGRHGKPHREQGRIGADGVARVGAWTQGRSRPAARVGRAKPAATRAPEEWPSVSARADRTRLTGRLAPLSATHVREKPFVVSSTNARKLAAQPARFHSVFRCNSTLFPARFLISLAVPSFPVLSQVIP